MITKIYLFFYNVIQWLGWSYILFLVIQNYIEGNSTKIIWNRTNNLLFLFQNAAVLEILHVVFRLVKAPFFTTAVQVFSRLLITFILFHIKETQTNWAFLLTIFSWSLVEFIRYLFYFLKELNKVPYIITWLRYSLFFILYPSGVFGELGILYISLNYYKKNNLFFYYLLLIIMITYIPGLPFMYFHMLKQRKITLYKSTLSESTKSPTNKKEN